MKAKCAINPKAEGLILDSVPGKQFNGQKILAYYYLSLELFKSDFVGELGFDYRKEYGLAKNFNF